jgi:glycosyltransferase involved in cell wall biosynthesis
MKSPFLDVYAITVDDDERSYRPHFDGVSASAGNITFLKRPDGWLKRYLDKIYPVRIGREAKKICRAHDVDVIHFLTVDYTCALILPRLKKIAAIYYTVHDFTPHESAAKNIRERLIDLYIRWGVEHNMKRAGNLATNSKSQFDAIKTACPGKNVYYHVFPSLITGTIVDGDDVCPELCGIGKYILFFGNIDKYKGVEFLYNAFKNNNKLSEYRLVIAGRGNIYFSHPGDPRIIFINRYIKDGEVKSLFEQAACVVYPYISATQSGVLTLAYKFQTPAIVSDIPFFRESSTGNCCLFFARAETADLSKQLETLLLFFGTDDLSKMKTAQKEYYDKNYSENVIISSLETIYTSAVITSL